MKIWVSVLIFLVLAAGTSQGRNRVLESDEFKKKCKREKAISDYGKEYFEKSLKMLNVQINEKEGKPSDWNLVCRACELTKDAIVKKYPELKCKVEFVNRATSDGGIYINFPSEGYRECPHSIVVRFGDRFKSVANVVYKQRTRLGGAEEVSSKQIKSIRKCAKKQMRMNPAVPERLSLSLTIGRNGGVDDIKLLSGEHRETYIHKCVVGVFRKFRFPKNVCQSIRSRRIALDIPKCAESTLKTSILSFLRIYEADSIGKDKAKDECHKDEEPAMPGRISRELNNSDVLAVMRMHISDFKECNRRQLEEDPYIKGKMVVRFVVEPSGNVTEVQIMTDKFKNTVVGDCISKVIRQLKFPRFKGDPMVIPFPFSVK